MLEVLKFRLLIREVVGQEKSARFTGNGREDEEGSSKVKQGFSAGGGLVFTLVPSRTVAKPLMERHSPPSWPHSRLAAEQAPEPQAVAWLSAVLFPGGSD